MGFFILLHHTIPIKPMNRYAQLFAHMACFAAYFIFGLNIVICKDIANAQVLSPFQLFTIRSVVVAAIFWILSAFTKKEHVPLHDLGKIFLASMLGIYITQLTFLKAITITRTIDLSIIGSLTPIMTMFVAAIFLKEPITWKKALGVFISFVGITILVLNSASVSSGVDSTSPLGVLLIITNCVSFALYLGIFRPVIERYSVITFMKWVFLFAALCSLPFTLRGLLTVNYLTIPTNVFWQIGFLIFFATFVAYFLIPFGQKSLRPTVISLYSYLQPIFAVTFSILTGVDTLSLPKVIALVLVLLGVYAVNRSRAAKQKLGIRN